MKKAGVQQNQTTAVWSVLLAAWALIGEQADFAGQRRRFHLHFIQQSLLDGCWGDLLLVCHMLQLSATGL